MTIGRTDDPENPFGAQAFQSRPSVWDWIADPIWASGHEPRQQAVHMIAVDPPVRILTLPLASKGPSTHAPTPYRANAWGGSHKTYAVLDVYLELGDPFEGRPLTGVL
jgi:hypothetical protein